MSEKKRCLFAPGSWGGGCRRAQLLRAAETPSTGRRWSWGLRWEQDPGASTLGMRVTAARLETPMGRDRLFAFQMLPTCNLQVCSLRESYPKITSSCCFACNSFFLFFKFLFNLQSFFQVRRGSKKQVPGTVTTLRCRMQRFYSQRGLPFCSMAFPSEHECKLAWNLHADCLASVSKSAEKIIWMEFSESSKLKRLCRATLCPSKAFWKNTAV